jgi:hypothetical protein
MAASAGRSRLAALSLGARLSVLLGVLLLLGAAYLFWSPLEKAGSAGVPFGCGSAAHPPSDGFATTVCGGVNERRQLQAGALTLAALTVGLGGVWAFAAARRRDGGEVAGAAEPGTTGVEGAPATSTDTAA